MNAVVIYATHHGTTQKVAQIIASELEISDVLAVSEAKRIDLDAYDTIILGCSIHVGSPQRAMKRFCSANIATLQTKKLALFLCCLNDEQFDTNRKVAYPEPLQQHAFAYKLVGGEYLLEKMSYLERIMTGKIAGVTKSQSRLNGSAISEFISLVKSNI